MKRRIIYLLFIVMLLQVGDAYAQGELWGTSKNGSAKIFKVDGSNPSLANYVNVYDFVPSTGTEPWTCVTPGGNGKLYGTTSLGGSSNLGVLFEYDPATSVYTQKVDLDGFISAAMTLAPNGKLYGTTHTGGVSGMGVLFEYDPSTNIYTKKVDFNSSSGQRSGPLALANNGKLYGTNSNGGSFGSGVIYEYDYVTDVFTKKVDLNAATGSYPNERIGLVLAGNGKFYGVTYAGGGSNAGVIFEYDPVTNAVTKKYDFISGSPDGSDATSLVLAGNGKIYGATWTGGTLDLGVIFEYDYMANTYVVKHNFRMEDAGAEVNGLTLSGNGKIYGVTNIGGGFRDLGYGALFEYDPASGSFTTKIVFDRENPNLPSLMVAGLVYVIPQTISFNIPDQSYGDPPFTISFTGGASGIPVVFTSSNHAVATVSGNTVTIVGPGTVTISASQAGTGNYLSAPNVSQTFTVHNRVNQAITFTTLADKNVGDAAFDLTATASSGLAVSYASSNGSVATVSGNTVTIVGGGTTIITASQVGNASYYAATPVTQILNVNKLNQTITFGPLADKSVGDASFDLTATASSALAVSYASSNTSVATVSGHTVSVVGPGTTIITASQAGNAQFNAAALVSQTLTVNKLNQTITFAALADKNSGDPDFNLTATASSPLAISYASSNTSVATVSGNTVTIVGAGTTIITALQAGNIVYNAATPVSQTMTVNKSSQTITFSALADRNIGANFNLTATASSALPVSYASSNTSVATVSGNSVTIIGSGTTIITASQAGNSSYNAATPVSQTLSVNKSNQTITFTALSDKNVNSENFNLTATASSSLPVSYASSNTLVATVSGNTVTIVGSGTTIITATQAGNASYNAATPVSRTLTVNKLGQTIGYFVGRQSYFMGEGPFDLIPTASSGLPLNFTSSDNNIATVSGSTMTIVGAGTATITATQNGNDSFNAAVPVSLVITVHKLNQFIIFDLTPKNMGDAAFNLPSTSSAGLPITYISNSPGVASISGNTVTIVAAGTVNITAVQQGNDTYNAATVTQQLTISKLNQGITFNSLSSKNMADAAFDLTGTASSGLPVSYVSSNSNVATVSGSTVTVVGYGTTIITASQPGDAIYNAAESVPRSLTVTRVDQSITFNPLGSKNVGDPAFNLTATANSTDEAVFYTSSNAAVATVSDNTVTIVGAGTTAITAYHGGDRYYNPATPVTQTLTVNKSNQTITFSELADKHVGDANFNLNGTASSSLAVSYASSNTSVATIAGNTVTIIGGGTTIITAYQSGNPSYNAATPVSQSLTVNKSDQTITFTALPDKNVADAAFELAATASSSLAISYSSSNTAVATISGSTVTIVGAGTTIITATQAGNASYDGAMSVTQSLTVNKSSQTITFDALANKVLGDADFALTATVSSGSVVPINYTSSNIGVATISGNMVTITGTGTTIITASHPGDPVFNAAAPVSQPLTVTAESKADQTISFNPISEQYFGDGTFNLTATASSGLPVTYVSSDETVATISGNTVTLVGGGVTIITASQSGDANYNPAIDVTRALKVNVGGQDITFGPLPFKTFGDAPFTVAATATSGLPVSYFSSDPSVAVVSDNLVTIIGAGTATITAWQGGDRNYDAANNVDQTLVVNKAVQTITFNALPAKTVGDVDFDLAGVTNSGLPVSYASSNPSVATISGNTVTIAGAGTTVITASQPGNTNYNAATDVQRTLTVNDVKANQTITFNALADKTVGDAAFDLTASASSGLTVAYTSSNTAVATISGSTVTMVGAGTTIITAAQPGDANFNAATPVTQILSVNKSTQTITFDVLSSKTSDDTTFDLTASASSGLEVSYTSSNTSVATISDNTVTITGAGTTLITASQAGNTSFYAAASVSQILTVTSNSNKLSQTITFDALADKTFGDADFSLAATATSGLPVTYTSSNTSVVAINGSTVTIVGAGIALITATQAGNASYQPAVGVTQLLTVNKKDQSIAFSPLEDKIVGDAAFNLTATASSGLDVTYTSTSDKVLINENQVTVSKAGRATIIASQPGNASYSEATSVSQSFCIKPAKPAITVSNAGTGSSLLISSEQVGNQWFLNDVAIDGATSSTYAMTQPGVYKVQVTVDDCISEFSETQSFIVTGNLESHLDDSSVEIYPNPASDWLTVSFTALRGKKTVTIFHLSGKETASRETDGTEVRFNVKDYAGGLYIVQIKTGRSLKRLRFIKE